MLLLSNWNLAVKIVKALKAIAHSESIQKHAGRRQSVLQQIEAGWARQSRRPIAAEVDAWISGNRV